MKHLWNYALILILGLSLPFATIHAADESADVPMVEGASTTSEEIDLTDLKNQPLAVRRQIVATQLTDIALKLEVIYDKTKAALDRLTQNGVDTSAAQLELQIAAERLADANLSIAAFSDPALTFKPTATQPTPLRDAISKAETQLRDGRDHILQALVSLKAAISISRAQ